MRIQEVITIYIAHNKWNHRKVYYICYIFLLYVMNSKPSYKKSKALIIACILLIPLSIVFVKEPSARIVLPISFTAILLVLVSVYRKEE